MISFFYLTYSGNCASHFVYFIVLYMNQFIEYIFLYLSCIE